MHHMTTKLIGAVFILAHLSCLQPSREEGQYTRSAGAGSNTGGSGNASNGDGDGGGDGSFNPTTANLTYADFVEPLFAQHCVICHNSGPNGDLPILETYDEVVATSSSSAETMFGIGNPMPPGNLLDPAVVQRFEDWSLDGHAR